MTDAAAIVFIVDDDPSVRKALGRLLRSAGFQVETFPSAQKFLEHELPDAPGCLVLDVRMPGLDGLELQRSLSEANITFRGVAPRMSRSLNVLFRRDPSRDRQDNQVHFEGYQFFWPDGQPVAVGLDAFCKHGQRLLGLGHHLGRCRERLIEIICFPLRGQEDDLNRLPGARVRRFFVERQGRQGRVHFMDGTPTAIVMDLDQDEESVLQWIGLAGLPDGERQWFDLAARVAESSPAGPAPVPINGPTLAPGTPV